MKLNKLEIIKKFDVFTTHVHDHFNLSTKNKLDHKLIPSIYEGNGNRDYTEFLENEISVYFELKKY